MWSYNSRIAKNYIQTIGFGSTREGKISGKNFPNLNFQFEINSITINHKISTTQTLVYLKTHNICFYTLREEDTDLHVLKITPFFIEEDEELTIRKDLFYMVQRDTAKGQHYQIQKAHNLTDISISAKLATIIANGPRTPLLDRAPLVFDALGNVVGILTIPVCDSSTQFVCRQIASNIDKDIIEFIEYVFRPFNRSQSVLD